MSLLSDDEIEGLRRIADRLRDQEGDEVCYGYFPGGDPNDFSPDPECSTDEEQAAWVAACARYADAPTPEPQQLCGFMSRVTGATQPRESFGLGTYTMRRSDVDLLANDLDRWLDRAREVGDMYR